MPNVTYESASDKLTFIIHEGIKNRSGTVIETITILMDEKESLLPVGICILKFAETLKTLSGKLPWHADGNLRLLEVISRLHHAKVSVGIHFEERELFDQTFYTICALVQDATFRPDEMLASHAAFLAGKQ